MVASQTKDTILDYTSPENIFLKFLNLGELPKGNISSPFSEDKKPSFRVYKNGTFKCFSTGKQGDVFQFVADLNQLDCKTHFPEITSIIAKEMNIILDNTFQNNSLAKPILHESKKALQNQNDAEKPFTVQVRNKSMSADHLEFWHKLGVGMEVLQAYNVNAVESFSFYSENKNKDITWNVYDYLAFSYQVNQNFEVYIPKQPGKNRDKFFCNGLLANDVFGLNQLQGQPCDNIIICAGKKDALVANSRGFKAVSFRSENHLPTEEQIKRLQSFCKRLFVCYDNDNGGQSGVERIRSKYPDIIQLELPQEINDLADYFQVYTKEDFQKLIEDVLPETVPIEKEEKKLTTIFHIAIQYLEENHELRFNAISLDIEIKKKHDNNWKSCNEDSLWLEMQMENIKIPQQSLIAILKSDFVPVYNPLKNYFENLLGWDGQDYIQQFAGYVTLDETENRQQFEYHFKKWCVRAVKCALIDGYFNKQAFVLTDDGIGQNIGKTSWCRFLCPPALSEYIAQDIPENEKDARILFAKNFLINLDELAGLSRKEINKLKSYFTLDKINERLPYDRKNSIIPRVASFIGSTNMSTFLQDETGSVRWLCFIVKSIDWNYRNVFDINKLWAQAYTLSKDNTFVSEMTRDDIRNNEARNEKFQVVSPEADLIREHIAPAKNSVCVGAEFLTSTKILQYLTLQGIGIRLSPVGVGKALTGNGFTRSKHDGVYGYWIVKKQEIITPINS